MVVDSSSGILNKKTQGVVGLGFDRMLFYDIDVRTLLPTGGKRQ
jgi:hypothetical protein